MDILINYRHYFGERHTGYSQYWRYGESRPPKHVTQNRIERLLSKDQVEVGQIYCEIDGTDLINWQNYTRNVGSVKMSLMWLCEYMEKRVEAEKAMDYFK